MQIVLMIYKIRLKNKLNKNLEAFEFISILMSESQYDANTWIGLE